MAQLERQVARSRRRLRVNRFLRLGGWTVTVAALAFAIVVVGQRLSGATIPLATVAGALVALAILIAAGWTMTGGADSLGAATALDEAAGLHERISSGLYCVGNDDPFARAVRADAERIAAGITVRRHLRIRAPRSLRYTLLASVAASATLLLPSGMLARQETVRQQQQLAARQTRVEVERRFDKIKKAAAKSDALPDLQAEIDRLGTPAPEGLDKPLAVRQDAINRIEKLADALRKKREADQYGRLRETKKLLRGLRSAGQKHGAVRNLSKALAEGNVSEARRQLAKLREQLGKMKSPADAAKRRELQRQLSELAAQLDKIALDKKLAQRLARSGLDPHDMERMLKNLTKKDQERIRQQLEKTDMSPKQISKLMEKLTGRSAAARSAQQLAKAMQQSADAMQAGEMDAAMGSLEAADEMLSEMEMLEQQLSELESMSAAVQDAKDGLGNSCTQCGGTGMIGNAMCSSCQGSGAGSGAGMGPKMGSGAGGKASEQQTATAFKRERTGVFTGRGRIIGRFLVDGSQVSGEASSELTDAVLSAERHAADAVNRERIPRQYHQAVKTYFSDVRQAISNREEDTVPAGTGTATPK